MRDYKQLHIWTRSYALSLKVYETTKDFPKEEKYSITSQIRRAAISIPSNIAEGCSRRTKKDFSNFLSMALGSLFELETQISLAYDLGYLKKESFSEISGELLELKGMLVTYISKVYKTIKMI